MLSRLILTLFGGLLGLFLLPEACLAWGNGHDDIVLLLWDYQPIEMDGFFSDEEYTVFKRNCHYPDLPNKTLEQTGEIVGAEDEAILKEFGYSNSNWLHSHTGRGVVYLLLRKAFREKNRLNAAFYISVLSHSVSDQGAINHTPILQFTTYSKFEAISYGIKNSCEFNLQNREVNRLVRHRLAEYSPKLLAETFREAVFAMIFDSYRQAEMAAEVELDIAYGETSLSNQKMADLASTQLESLLDMVYTAWKLADSEENLTREMFSELGKREELRRRLGKPENDAVYAGLFDASLNPKNPHAIIGLVCEPFGSFHVRSLSYVGKMLTASAGRSLRDHGYGIQAISLWKLETEPLPEPRKMPVLVIFAGSCRISLKMVENLKKYCQQGGKLFYVAGADPENLTGMANVLKKCNDDEVPVSSKWGIQNEELYGAMRVAFSSAMPNLNQGNYAFRRNPNFDGFCKPTCVYRIEERDGQRPLAWLNNGRETICISAVNEHSAWVPEYLLLPFLFSDAKTIRWTELRLDPFAEKVFLDTLNVLLKSSVF